MKTIILASNNQGKIKEFRALLEPFSIQIITLADVNITDDIEETGLTFIENAIIKARYASKESGLPALADDSGLVVPALDGAPGIYSARYSAEKTDEANNRTLLRAMKSLNDNQRHAYFTSVLTLFRSKNDPSPLIAQGDVHGTIVHEIRGNGGFGYDPLFFVPSLNQTFAEVDISIKNQISHRAIAAQKLIQSIQLLKTPLF